MVSLYTSLGFKSTAADSVKESFVKYLKKDASSLSTHKLKRFREPEVQPEQLSFSEDILQAGNEKLKRVA